jgi:hypothetical protein
MTPTDIISRVRLNDVAETLGVKLDRTRRRCICPWREDADGWNVSLDDSKGLWFDHARAEGGGVLDFIARVRGCNRKAALEWLAAYCGVPLGEQTEGERRDWARRIRAAEPEARRLVEWKLDTLEALREQRDRLLRIYHHAKHFILNHDVEQCEATGDLRFELALSVGWSYWIRIRALDRQIDRLEAASYADLLARFRGGAAA